MFKSKEFKYYNLKKEKLNMPGTDYILHKCNSTLERYYGEVAQKDKKTLIGFVSLIIVKNVIKY